MQFRKPVTLGAVALATSAGVLFGSTGAHAAMSAKSAAPSFTKVWQSSFPVTTKGAFTKNAAYSKYWFAYPSSWQDTAMQRGYKVGGYYDPNDGRVVKNAKGSGNHLQIVMWRRTGNVHSYAVVPLRAKGRKYGKYVETWQVTRPTTGYKSAHLLWPSSGNQNTTTFEVDYPENEWNTVPFAFVHSGANNSQQSFDSGVKWTGRHTTVIEWWPGHLRFYMDGKLIGSTTRGAPTIKMDWVLQNESALNGQSAPVNSSAQMNIYSVAYYKYNG